MASNNDKAVVAAAQVGAIAVVSDGVEERLDILKEELGAGDLDFSLLEVVKTPGSGAVNWEIPSTGDAVKEIVGVPILRKMTRGYWNKRRSEGGDAPPACSSDDSLTGYGDNNTGEVGPHDCGGCPLNQFGTAIGDDGQPRGGKACKEMPQVFIASGDSILPTLVRLGPTSVQPVRKFFVGTLGARGIKPTSQVIAIGLEKKQSAGGDPYSVPRFRIERALTPEEAQRAQEYASSIAPALARTARRVLDGEYADAD